MGSLGNSRRHGLPKTANRGTLHPAARPEKRFSAIHSDYLAMHNSCSGMRNDFYAMINRCSGMRNDFFVMINRCSGMINDYVAMRIHFFAMNNSCGAGFDPYPDVACVLGGP